MMEAYSNVGIILKLKEGDETAFANIYQKYHNAVYANICKLVNNATEAEDILQEVFVLLWKQRSKLSESITIDGWLFSTSYFKSMEYLRKALKENASIYKVPEVAPDHEEEYEALYEEKLALLNYGIQQLSPQKKIAFTLCRLHGKSYEEAATHMCISVQTVKDYVKQSVIFLKKYAAKYPTIFTAFALCCLNTFLHS